MVEAGRFREDLFYRLEVIPVQLPPLRERRGDIPALAEHFLQKKCAQLGRALRGFTPAAERALAAYSWPGNVRELENVVERTVVLSDGEEIDASDLPLFASAGASGGTDSAAGEGASGSLNQQLEDLERRLIEEALQQSGGVKTQAAEILGIKTSALYYKLDKYGLQ
jgi:two-component system response regulator HydG